MIGTIRKHSKWLWWGIAILTIISFVIFMGAGPSHSNNGAGGDENFGLVYGRAITPEEYRAAQKQFALFYWFRNQEWPDQSSGVTQSQLEQQTYENILLARKAAALGIHVSDDQLADYAARLLRIVGRNQSVSLEQFYENVLRPKGYTIADFQNFVRADLAVQQLVQVLGLSGALVTPQEASSLYDRENQEVSTEAVFFDATNYLSQVVVAPAAVAQFYTNEMAYYRLPDRVQISYIKFNVTNFLEQSKSEWAKTNFSETVDTYYDQNAATEFAHEKSPDAAKEKIRAQLIRQRALFDADEKAKEFVTALFAMEPVKPENLAALAQQKKITLHATAPFSANYGPQEFDAPQELVKDAFQLNAESPFAGPVVAEDGIYVIALTKQLPSDIPAFAEIQARVTRDYQMQQAAEIARRDGTNFWQKIQPQVAAGKQFTQAAVAAGKTPEILPAFSPASSSIPGFDGRAQIGLIKHAAFTTTVGKISPFEPTGAGGFVLFVQSLLPIDETAKTKQLPDYTAQLRRARENEAFSLWINSELNRQLPTSPYFQRQFLKAQQGG